MTLVKLVDIIPTRWSDRVLPTRTLPCGPPQCFGPSPSGITSVLRHLRLAQLLSLSASFPPDRSAHLPTSALCLVRRDWVWFSTQFTCGLLHQNQNQTSNQLNHWVFRLNPNGTFCGGGNNFSTWLWVGREAYQYCLLWYFSMNAYQIQSI